MKRLIIKWFSKPLLPALIQAHRVLLAVEASLNDVLKVVTDLGIPTDTPVFNTVKTVITAVIAVKVTVIKVVEFLGGVIESSTKTATLNLQEELEKLKEMM